MHAQRDIVLPFLSAIERKSWESNLSIKLLMLV